MEDGELAVSAHDLSGKAALVTGAARGQGRAEAAALVRAGARVLLTDVLDDEGAAAAAEFGDAAAYARLDVGDEQGWREVVASAVERFGRLDVLVNNAGIWRTQLLEDETLENFERMLRVNLIGPFLGMREVVPVLRAGGGGSIINVSSTNAMQGATGHAAYGAGKWGLRGINRTAAIELAAAGIRVNAVMPGAIDTPMLAMSDDVKAAVATRIPVGRLGTAPEVAEVVVFLASDASSYVTGQEIVVDGGLTAGATLAPPTR